MSVALFSLHPEGIDVGAVGDPSCQAIVQWAGHRDEVFADTLKLHAALKRALDVLLVAPHVTTVVVLEPPLFALPWKQAMADALLGWFRVFAVGFLQQSVCCIAGHKLSAGTVVDPVEKLVVPVYDYRELTPFITALDELEEGAAIECTARKAAIDVRRPLRESVVKCSRREVWLGASALTSQRTVWPLITREKYAEGRKVWDSLFDMR